MKLENEFEKNNVNYLINNIFIFKCVQYKNKIKLNKY